MAKKPHDIAYVHVPQEGHFVVGVPKRDLTQADVDRLGPIAIGEALATGLYKKAPKQEPAKADDNKAKAEDGEK